MAKQQVKRGAPEGNQNGVRFDAPATDWLRQRAVPEHKAQWEAAAKKQGYKHLSKWVTDVLNAQAKAILD
ncbi:hypothetical protein [Endozoicomonas lisbonensis]|uniref:Uncharacterized protein n=1 Tax=Endozoicomonas lisbonensis TaxID=3120522 RepID=A0ABV2SPC9_9GAMM